MAIQFNICEHVMGGIERAAGPYAAWTGCVAAVVTWRPDSHDVSKPFKKIRSYAFYVKATENMAAMGKLVTALGGKLIKVDQGLLTERFVVTDDAGMVILNNVRLA
ncbi:hypothetical protein P5W99_25795 [Paraburkholderia sp. A3BS-1L]|jgi:hypothetical protein|uniref:hypothetical protein n=1 Tax=Paraburkholderia sp. A3BS-1L TaxID=3028375 RepID=UPI003DAA3A28